MSVDIKGIKKEKRRGRKINKMVFEILFSMESILNRNGGGKPAPAQLIVDGILIRSPMVKGPLEIRKSDRCSRRCSALPSGIEE